GYACTALFDSGCTGMVLSERFLSSHPSIFTAPPMSPLTASVADQRTVPISLIAPGVAIQTPVSLFYYDFIIAPVKYDIIVGTPWMATHNAAIDWDS
ncbi:hypothetical protein IW152_006145, partial [Coemansia sp. BCRC 34962]